MKLLTDVVIEGLLASNPAIGVKPSRPGQSKRRFPTVSELVRHQTPLNPPPKKQ